MVKLVNRAKMDTATTGTGTISLNAAYPAYQSFADAGVSDGETVRYAIEENNNWEIGTGVYTASGTTLTRNVTESSNAGSAINLQGNAVVYVTAVVGDFLEPDNNLSDLADAATALGNLGVTATTTEINYLSGVTGNLQTQLDSISVTAGSLTKSFTSGETASITLSSAISPAPVVSATKEVPQVGIVSKGAWDVATTGANYTRLDSAYNTTLTPSNASGDGTFTLGAGAFSSSDVGKTIEGNGGVAVLTATNGSYHLVTAFANTDTIASGSWAMYGLTFDDLAGLSLSSAPLNSWNVSQASYSETLPRFFVGDKETQFKGVFFKSDGLRLYAIGNDGDDVNQYNLSTAWDLSTATFSTSFSVSAKESFPSGIFFKSDGTKMYVLGIGSDSIHEYVLSTPWQISSAVWDTSQSVSTQTSEPKHLFFKPDGTKLYILGGSIQDSVFEYNLSTPWATSSRSLVTSYGVSSQDSDPKGLFFKDDGTKMYVVGNDGDDVNEYNLGTAWNVSTATYSKNFSIASEGTSPEGIFFKTDGTKMYVVQGNSSTLFVYDISTAWDISTASITYPTNNYLKVSSQDTNPNDIFFSTDGTKMYMAGNTGDSIYQYNLSTAWNIASASFVQSFSVATQEASVEGVYFKPDGTSMYVIGSSSSSVHRYNLSTAWDITTATYIINFSVSAKESIPRSLSFKPDGTVMYVIGSNSDSVHQYALGTAWDISGATYAKSFSVAAQATAPVGLYFKPDGTKMYVVGNLSDTVFAYNLSTAWDISTASLIQSFSVAAEAGGVSSTGPVGLYFKPDGTKMYVASNAEDEIIAYNIGSPVLPLGQYFAATTNAAGQIDSTFWLDINSMTADQASNDGEVYYAVSTDDHTTWSVIKDADGVRPIVRNNAGTWEYNSNTTYGLTTWTSATTNAELNALQQALSVTANRMDKTQLEAVTDPNHYTLGNTLDLMIALYLGTTSTSPPTSDGVSINYDAESLNKGAILGTDYDFDFPDSTTVRVTSLATQNLKIRVV